MPDLGRMAEVEGNRGGGSFDGGGAGEAGPTRPVFNDLLSVLIVVFSKAGPLSGTHSRATVCLVPPHTLHTSHFMFVIKPKPRHNTLCPRSPPAAHWLPVQGQ